MHLHILSISRPNPGIKNERSLSANEVRHNIVELTIIELYEYYPVHVQTF